jgi:hypothetical protein
VLPFLQRLMNRVVLVVCFVLSLGFAGCTGTDFTDDDGAKDPSRPATSLTVSAATVRSGYCFDDSGFGDGQWCHILTVQVDNTNNNDDFSNNMFFWEAVGNDGGVYDAPDQEGPDSFIAGGGGQITLKFDLESQSVRLTQLRYADFSVQLTASIPTY